MARGVVMVVVVMVVVTVMVVEGVGRAEARYGSAMAEFSTAAASARRGLEEELSVWEDPEDEFLDEPTRRMLAARRRSYISYGALNGNRSPCPSRSGRSYYTPNCARQNGPVMPYRRGCSQITRCARG